jgi:hypothetical protein
MIEIVLWLLSLFAVGAIMLQNPYHVTRAAGFAYIIVGIGACLGLYLHLDTVTLNFILGFMSEWWVLEVFIFLNIVTGYASYDSRTHRKPN